MTSRSSLRTLRLSPRLPLVAACAGLACATLAACGASRFDRLYEIGRFEQAMALYEEDPRLRRDEGALYRAALMRSRPDSPVYDPEAARRDLELLLERFPGTSRREAIRVHLALLEELIRERMERAAAVSRLEETIAGLRATETRRREALAEREERIDLLMDVVERLREDLEARERRLAALEEELERLKAIDLDPP